MAKGKCTICGGRSENHSVYIQDEKGIIEKKLCRSCKDSFQEEECRICGEIIPFEEREYTVSFVPMGVPPIVYDICDDCHSKIIYDNYEFDENPFLASEQ